MHGTKSLKLIKVILYMLTISGSTLRNLVVRVMCTSGVGLTQTFVWPYRRQIVWHQRHSLYSATFCTPTASPFNDFPSISDATLHATCCHSNFTSIFTQQFLRKQRFRYTVQMFLVRSKLADSLLTGAQDSHLQRVTIPEAAYIQLRRRPPEDEQVMLETCTGV